MKPYRLAILLILLMAAVLRLYGLNNLSPPGLEHDEVAHWLINQDIVAGHHAIYFTEAYGHEAGFHYYQTVFMLLLGDNTLALRLPSAFAGLLGVAVTYALIRRLFGLKTALFSAALLAALLWSVFYSRLGLRAIGLPLLSGLSAYFWWRGWDRMAGESGGRQGSSEIPRPHPPAPPLPNAGLFCELSSKLPYSFALAGLFAGLSLHTYMAARAVPIFYGLFTLYLFLTQRPNFRRRWPGIALFFLVYALVALPLLTYLLNHPQAEFRISEVDAPLRAFQHGDLRPVLENTLKIAGMFGFQGDPLWRQNVADLPVFDPLTALFFYLGAFTILWQWRKPRCLFLLLWLSTAAIPSIVTIDAPSSIRIINALPVLAVFPAIGLRVIHNSRRLSTVFTGLSTTGGGKLTISLGILMLLLTLGRTTWNLFEVWPAAEEVQFVWQASFTEIAAYLDNTEDNGPVAIGGWTPDTMDPPTVSLLLHRNDLSLRHFDPTQALILPAAPAGQAIRLFRPSILPLDSALEQQLLAWNAVPTSIQSFTFYQLDQAPSPQPQFPAAITFENEISFLGYDLLDTTGSVHLLTFWRVERPANGPRRFFLHLVNAQGQPVSQQDTLGAPAEQWQPGDLLLQIHTLAIPASDTPLSLHLGLYNPLTNQRLSAGDSDFIRLDLP